MKENVNIGYIILGYNLPRIRALDALSMQKELSVDLREMHQRQNHDHVPTDLFRKYKEKNLRNSYLGA